MPATQLVSVVSANPGCRRREIRALIDWYFPVTVGRLGHDERKRSKIKAWVETRY